MLNENWLAEELRIAFKENTNKVDLAKSISEKILSLNTDELKNLENGEIINIVWQDIAKGILDYFINNKDLWKEFSNKITEHIKSSEVITLFQVNSENYPLTIKVRKEDGSVDNAYLTVQTDTATNTQIITLVPVNHTPDEYEYEVTISPNTINKTNVE